MLSPIACLTAALLAAFHALGIQVGGVISSKQHLHAHRDVEGVDARVREGAAQLHGGVESMPFPVGTSSTEVWR